MTTDTVPAVKVGDIFYSSWGYDQTNIDWYEVVGLTASGKSVKLRRIAARQVGSTGYEDQVVPAPGEYWVSRWDTDPDGAVLTRRLRIGYGGVPVVRVDSIASAWLWDGKPKSRTAAGFGH